MQDRPTADELLAAIERFLEEEIVPNTPGSRGFHARVAANSIRILRRELEGGMRVGSDGTVGGLEPVELGLCG